MLLYATCHDRAYSVVCVSGRYIHIITNNGLLLGTQIDNLQNYTQNVGSGLADSNFPTYSFRAFKNLGIKYQSVAYIQEQLEWCELKPYMGWVDPFGLMQPAAVGRVETVLRVTGWIYVVVLWVGLLSCGLGWVWVA